MLNKLDKSNYLRGQIILIRLDREISEYEKIAIVRMAKILDLSSEFCSDVIEELIYNPYLSYSHPIFSSKEIGQAFLYDALKLAYSDGNFNLNEINWVKNTAKINGIEKSYWLQIMMKYKKMKKIEQLDYNFAIYNLLN
jgi:hypothetical protein